MSLSGKARVREAQDAFQILLYLAGFSVIDLPEFFLLLCLFSSLSVNHRDMESRTTRAEALVSGLIGPDINR